jgi:hypothetical protein
VNRDQAYSPRLALAASGEPCAAGGLRKSMACRVISAETTARILGVNTR